MRKHWKKCAAWLLAAVLLLSIQGTAFAASEDVAEGESISEEVILPETVEETVSVETEPEYEAETETDSPAVPVTEEEATAEEEETESEELSEELPEVTQSPESAETETETEAAPEEELAFMELDAGTATGTLYTLELTGTYNQTKARQMLSLINSYRTGGSAWYYLSSGTRYNTGKLSALSYDYNLEKAAMVRAAEIVLSFSHTRLNGGSMLGVNTYGSVSYAENIAYTYSTSPSEVYDLWLETDDGYSGQGHRRNMLSASYTSVGIAGFTYNGRTYWVQEFGKTGGTSAVSANDGETDVTLEYSDSRVSSQTVSAAVSSLSLNKGKSIAAPKANATIRFLSLSSYSESYSGQITPRWTSGNTSVLTVSGSTVTGVSAGTTSLTATVGDTKLTVAVTVTDNLLDTPELKSVTNTTEGAKLVWEAVTGAAQYRVYYKASGGWTKVVDTTGTSYVIPESLLTSGQTYYYTVRCLSADGKKFTSGYESPGLKRMYLSPLTPSFANKSTGMQVKWPEVTGAEGYYVYRKGSDGYVRIATIDDPDTLSYVDTAVKNGNGTAYNYAVKAYNGKDTGAYTAKSYYRVTGVEISSMVNSAAGTLTVKWGQNTKANGYQLQYSTSSTFASGNTTVTISDGGTVSKAISSLTKGTTYYLRIRAYKTNSAGTKYYSAWSGKEAIKLSR